MKIKGTTNYSQGLHTVYAIRYSYRPLSGIAVVSMGNLLIYSSWLNNTFYNKSGWRSE